MLKSCAKDISFAAMLCQCPPHIWPVVHERIHYDWYKWFRVIIVRTIDMSICRDLGVHIGLSEEQ